MGHWDSLWNDIFNIAKIDIVSVAIIFITHIYRVKILSGLITPIPEMNTWECAVCSWWKNIKNQPFKTLSDAIAHFTQKHSSIKAHQICGCPYCPLIASNIHKIKTHLALGNCKTCYRESIDISTWEDIVFFNHALHKEYDS